MGGRGGYFSSHGTVSDCQRNQRWELFFRCRMWVVVAANGYRYCAVPRHASVAEQLAIAGFKQNAVIWKRYCNCVFTTVPIWIHAKRLGSQIQLDVDFMYFYICVPVLYA